MLQICLLYVLINVLTVNGGGPHYCEYERSNPCQNEATCNSHNSGYSYSCTCRSGFTGSNCELIDCSSSLYCLNGGTCNLINGGTGHTCSCAEGWTGTNCEQIGCPTNCAQCDIDGNQQKCDKCKAGYWLRAENVCSLCPSNCEQCADATQCTECKPSYWDIQPLMTCDSNCRETCTASGCDDTTGHCYGCPPGFYGSYCDRDCDLCADGLCELRLCKVGCKEGYYESRDNDFECKVCSHHCASCDNDTQCKQCENGFYLLSYPNDDRQICLQCSASCLNGCDSNGICLGGCQDGWTGIKCAVRCANRCRKCDQNDSNSCITCEGDFYTKACIEPCSSHCSTRPGLVNCDIHKGTCFHGCDNGYWGAKCDKQCSDGCNAVSCNQFNGFCDTCRHTHYGGTCQFKCSEHCVDKGAPSAICNQTNGKCVNGCEDGYSGDTCQLSITSTTQSTIGIIEKCDHTDPIDSYTKPFLIGILTGVGICVLFVAAFIATRRLRRMRQNTSSNKNEMEPREYENTAITMQVVSSDETVDIDKVGCNEKTFEGVGSIYERLDGDTRDDQHAYSGLERQTYQHGSRFANMK